MSSENKVALARESLDRTNSWIANSDIKSQVILAGVGVVLSLMLSSGLPSTVHELIQAIAICDSFLQCIALLLLMLCFGAGVFCFGTGLYHLYRALVPHLKDDNAVRELSRSGKTDGPEKNRFYFGDIASMDFSEMDERYSTINENRLFTEYLQQLQVNSVIANEKMENNRKGLREVGKGFIFLMVFLFACPFAIG